MTRIVLLLAVAALGCASKETRVAQGAEAHAIDAPANVLEAAKIAVPGLVVSRTETEIERGVRIYDVTGTANGKTYEVEVTADGKVTDIDDDEGDDDGEDDDLDDDDEDGDDDD